jgi:hypothetical protein
MNRRDFPIVVTCSALLLYSAGCNSKSDPQAEAPPPLRVERVEDRNVFQVERPERFQLTMAVEHVAAPELRVTGTVNPDILGAQPVLSLAMGRVVENTYKAMRTEWPPGEGTPEVNTCWLMTRARPVLLDPATVENVTFPGSQRKECV